MKPFCIALLCLVCSLCYGQEKQPPIKAPIVLDQENLTTKFFGTGKLSYNFEAGDEYQFSLTMLKGKRLKKVEIHAPSGLVTKIKKPSTITNQGYNSAESGQYLFKFKNRRILPLWKKRYQFTLNKILTVEPEEEKELKDIVVLDTSFMEIEETELAREDTLMLQMIDTSFTIHPRKNFFEEPRKFFEIILPEKTEAWAYWIGVGQEAQTAYAILTEGLPQEWGNQDAAEPMHAYLKNLLSQLPTNPSGEDLTYYFTDLEGKEQFMLGRGIDNIMSEGEYVLTKYGKFQNREPDEPFNFFVCLENDNQNSDIEVHLKIISLLVEREYKTETRDSMIVQRTVVDVNETDARSLNEAKKEVTQEQEDLYYAMKKFQDDMEERQTRLDSIKTLREKEFALYQEKLNVEKLKVKIRERKKEIQETANLSEREASAKAELEALQQQLKAAKEKISALNKQIEEIRKIAKLPKQQVNQLGKFKDKIPKGPKPKGGFLKLKN
ncbi:MAG: hypothetical protein AAF502_03590 [Bacteroidota bacterium]